MPFDAIGMVGPPSASSWSAFDMPTKRCSRAARRSPARSSGSGTWTGGGVGIATTTISPCRADFKWDGARRIVAAEQKNPREEADPGHDDGRRDGTRSSPRTPEGEDNVLTSSIKERKNYGWTVVGVGIVIGCIGMGSMMSLSIFLQPMAEAMGWTRAGISTAALFNFLAMGVGSFLWGALS